MRQVRSYVPQSGQADKLTGEENPITASRPTHTDTVAQEHNNNTETDSEGQDWQSNCCDDRRKIPAVDHAGPGE